MTMNTVPVATGTIAKAEIMCLDTMRPDELVDMIQALKMQNLQQKIDVVLCPSIETVHTSLPRLTGALQNNVHDIVVHIDPISGNLKEAGPDHQSCDLSDVLYALHYGIQQASRYKPQLRLNRLDDNAVTCRNNTHQPKDGISVTISRRYHHAFDTYCR